MQLQGVAFSFKLDCPPVQDSPSTPATPESPPDITLSVAEVGSEGYQSKSPVTCVAPGLVTPLSTALSCPVTPVTTALSDSAHLSLYGRLRVCRDKNRTPTTLFEPLTCESAKTFLSAARLPPRFPFRRDPLETPKTSRNRAYTMICHGCHMQMGQGAHNGSAPGKALCTLPHSVSCLGGIIEDNTWRACPPGYAHHGQTVPTSGFQDTLSMTDFMSSTPASGAVGLFRQPQLTPQVHALQQTVARPPQQSQENLSITQQNLTQDGTNTVQSLPSLLQVSSVPSTLASQAPISSTPVSIFITNPTPPSMTAPTTTTAPGIVPQHYDSTVEQVVQDLTRLSVQDIGAGTVLPTGTGSGPGLPEDFHQKQVEALRSANQHHQGHSSVQMPGTLNIAALRAMPGLQDVVERQWQELRTSIPALSAARSAQVPPVDLLPPGGAPYVSLRNVQQSVPNISQPLFTSLPYATQNHVAAQALTRPQTGVTMPGISAVQQPQHTLGGAGQLLSSSRTPLGQVQGAQQLEGHQAGDLSNQGQQILYKLEYRCSPSSGETFQVLVPVHTGSHNSQPAPARNPVKYEWRCDPNTGQTYQVPVQQSSPQVQSARAEYVGLQYSATPQVAAYAHQVAAPPHHHLAAVGQYPNHVHSHQEGPPQHQGAAASLPPMHVPSHQSPSPQQSQHLKGISPLLEGGGATKKAVKVIDFARKCPVRWAKLAKPENINLPLYSYGAVTELEAALSGRGEPLSEEVLLAKICHLKNIFEVCCLNSSPTDFSSYGWLIARDYATKVEDEVEQRFVQWQTMSPGIRTQTLVLSQMENPRAPAKKKPNDDLPAPKKDRCTTFNTCMTEMKCEYEVSNPGRTCQRKHECTWCRKNLQQGYKHQEWKCLKKQAANQ